MDRLETWEIPFTSACERTGSSGSRSNNDPGLEGPSDLPGAQTARHEARRSAWTSEAKQISDRGCVAGSRSTPIGPVTSGNRTNRDPIMNKRAGGCGRQSLATRSRLARHPPIVRGEPARSTPLDVDHVRGVQGRYFVVVLPVAAIFVAIVVNRELPNAVPAAIAITG